MHSGQSACIAYGGSAVGSRSGSSWGRGVARAHASHGSSRCTKLEVDGMATLEVMWEEAQEALDALEQWEDRGTDGSRHAGF